MIDYMEIHAAAQDPLPFQGCWASHGESQDGEACIAQAWCAEGSTTSFLVDIMFIYIYKDMPAHVNKPAWIYVIIYIYVHIYICILIHSI